MFTRQVRASTLKRLLRSLFFRVPRIKGISVSRYRCRFKTPPGDAGSRTCDTHTYRYKCSHSDVQLFHRTIPFPPRYFFSFFFTSFFCFFFFFFLSSTSAAAAGKEGRSG